MRTPWGLAVGAALSLAACEPYYVPVEEPDASSLERSEGLALAPASRVEGIPVLITTRLSHPAEVVAIVDVEVAHGQHDRALHALRQRAAEAGADAVVGVAFEHGDGRSKMHLSGLAVRILR